MRRPDCLSNAGNCEAAAHRVRLFFGYLLLAKQKKVTCCRATPDGLAVNIHGEMPIGYYALRTLSIFAIYRFPTTLHRIDDHRKSDKVKKHEYPIYIWLLYPRGAGSAQTNNSKY